MHSITKNRIKVVSFDLWLTLIRSNSTPNKATRAAAMYKLLGIEPLGVTHDEFKTTVREVEKFADMASEMGVQHYGPYERVKLVAERYGVPMLSDEDFTAFYAAQFERFMAYPPDLMQDDIIDILTTLAGRYQLALISNTGFVNGAEMRPALKAIGLLDLFDHHIFSDEVGVNKPHPRIFEHLLELSGVQASNIVHIGDNRTADYNGARAVGFQAIHLPSTLTVREAVSTLL